MPRTPRALALVAGVVSSLSFGVLPVFATPATEAAARVVVTTTTTSDIDVATVSRGSDVTRAIVDRAVAGPVRLAGADRYGTSVQISRRAYTRDTAKVVGLTPSGGHRLSGVRDRCGGVVLEGDW